MSISKDSMQDEQDLARIDEYLKTIGKDVLIGYSDDQKIFSPLFSTQIDLVDLNLFTPPHFVTQRERREVKFEDVLTKVENSNENLLIEAPSGAGKTTLCRMLLARKKSGEKFGNTTIIPIDCRKRDIETLNQLIADIFPDATNDFSSEKLLRAVMSQIPLFFIDGLDESNDKSKKLVSEIIFYARKSNARFVATSRTRKEIQEFLINLDQLSYEHLLLTGIDNVNLNSFISKYFEFFTKDRINEKILEDICKSTKNISSKAPHSPFIASLAALIHVENKPPSLKNETDLFENWLQLICSKLKTVLQNNKNYKFEEDNFKVSFENFTTALYELSFKLASENKIEFEEHEFKFPSEEEIFKTEFISCVFVKRIDKKTPETILCFPHKSVQEFLAAKYITTNICTGPKTNLYQSMERNPLENERSRFLVLGILARNHNLTQTLSDEIINFWKPRSLELNFLDIVRQSFGATEVLESISNLVRRVEIDDQHVVWNLLLERCCPKLKRVDMKRLSDGQLIRHSMSLLTEKEVDISMDFHSKCLTNIDDILVPAFHGRCRIREFEGRLGESGLKLLPKSMNELTLWIRTGEEIQAVEWLSEATMHPKYQKESFQAQRLDIRRIVLIIEDECEVSSLPKKLPSASYKVDIRLPSKTYGNWQRVFDVIGWLKTVERKFPYTRVWFILPETNDFDLLIRLHEFVKVSESFPTSVYYHSSSYLTDNEGEAIQLDANCFEANPHIDELPEKIVQLTVQLRKSEQLKELQILRERLQGGNERVKPMQVLKLVIEVFDSCEATDDLNLLEGFPLSSRHLVTRFKSDNEESYQRDLDIDWIHKFVKKLPKNEWCHINIGNYNFSFEFWKSFIEILYKESLNVIVWNKFKDIPEDDLYALWEKFAGNTILRKTPTLPMPM